MEPRARRSRVHALGVHVAGSARHPVLGTPMNVNWCDSPLQSCARGLRSGTAGAAQALPAGSGHADSTQWRRRARDGSGASHALRRIRRRGASRARELTVGSQLWVRRLPRCCARPGHVGVCAGCWRHDGRDGRASAWWRETASRAVCGGACNEWCTGCLPPPPTPPRAC